LIETMVALSLCALTLSGFYLAMSQGMRLARAAQDSAQGSDLVHQRIDTVRRAALWKSVVTREEVSQVFVPTLASGARLSRLVETCTVRPYPAGGSAFVIQRDAAGNITTSGTSLPETQRCVQVSVQAAWRGPMNRTMTSSTSTVLTKGGI
jgi:hypothetical protein